METTFNESYWSGHALTVQDACNLSGVVIAFSKMVQEMAESGMSTMERNTHPLSVLFASKVASLTQCEHGLTFAKAFEWASDEKKRRET